MAYYDKIVNEVAELTGLQGDGKTGMISGNYRGYTIVAQPLQQRSNGYLLKVSVIGQDGEWMDQKEANRKIRETASIKSLERYGTTWVANLKNKMTAGKQGELISEAMRELTEFLRMENQQNVCSGCGEVKTTQPAMINGESQILCEECFRKEQTAGIARQLELEEKPENVAGGILGALLGSLIGVIVIVLLGQLGYVAALSGVVMGVCALVGYEKLGGKLTTKGIVISILIMIVMVWVGTRLDWSIFLQREVFTEESIPSVFMNFEAGLDQLAEEGMDVTSEFVGELIMQYLFSALGAVGVIVTKIRQKKAENTASRL